MCSLHFYFSFLADLKVRFERPSYTVIENESPLEVCGVLSNPASQTLVIRGIAQESSPPDAKGMYVLKQLLLLTIILVIHYKYQLGRKIVSLLYPILEQTKIELMSLLISSSDAIGMSPSPIALTVC